MPGDELLKKKIAIKSSEEFRREVIDRPDFVMSSMQTQEQEQDLAPDDDTLVPVLVPTKSVAVVDSAQTSLSANDAKKMLDRNIHANSYETQRGHEDTIRIANALQASQFGGKDSPEMKEIKRGINSLVSSLYEPITDFDFGKNADAIAAIEEKYKSIILACKIYEDAKHPSIFSKSGKARKKMVSMLKERCNVELNLFAQNAKEMLAREQEEKVDGNPLCWNDVLYYVRAEHYEEDIFAQKPKGGAMSEVYQMRDKDGTKGFFVEDKYIDAIPMHLNFEAYMDGAVSALVDSRSLTKEQKQETAHTLYALKLHFTELTKNMNKDQLALLDTVLEDLFVNGINYADITKEQRAVISGSRFELVVASEAFDTTVISAILHADKSLMAKKFTREVTKIKGKGSMVRRNVGMSRVDEMLGFGVVQKSKTVTIETQGKLHTGNFMEKAEGAEISQIVTTAAMKDCQIVFTGEAREQLLKMQIVDFICGQIDRHGSNIYAEFEFDEDEDQYVITRVRGIDNDNSFGVIDKKALSRGYNRFPGIMSDDGRLVFKNLTKSMYDAIMSLNVDTVAFNLADLDFDKSELDALKDRITFLQEKVEKEYGGKALPDDDSAKDLVTEIGKGRVYFDDGTEDNPYMVEYGEKDYIRSYLRSVAAKMGRKKR